MGSGRELFLLLGLLWRQGFPGRVIFGSGGLYLLLGVVACLRPLSRRTPVLAGLLGVAGLGTLGGGLALVIGARRGMLGACGLAAMPPELGGLIGFAGAVERGEIGLLLLACGLVWTAVFGGVVMARSVLRRAPEGADGAEGAPPFVGGIALVVFSAVLGGALLARSSGTVVALWNEHFAGGALKSMIEAAEPVRRQVPGAVLVGAVIAATIAGVLAWGAVQRGAPPPGAREKVACGGLFAVGLLAFALTRAHAADASAGLPPQDWLTLQAPEDEARSRLVPVVTRCPEWGREHEGVWVELRESGVRVDGVERSAGELPGLLRDKRELHERLGRGPMPPVLLWAERGAKVAPMVPFWRAVQEGWPGRFGIVATRPLETWESRTLGAFPRTPRTCPVVALWGAGGRAMSSLGSWQEVASAVEAAPEVVWAP